MVNVNKVIIAGRLTKNPEIKYGQTGNAMCKLNVVTNDRYKDKGGEWKEVSEFHNVTVFGKMAENISNNVRKGATVYVEGQLKTNKWQDQSGQMRYQTQIQAMSVMYDKANGNGNAQSQQRTTQQPADTDDVPF